MRDELHAVPLWARGRRPTLLKAQGPSRVKPSEETEDLLAAVHVIRDITLYSTEVALAVQY